MSDPRQFEQPVVLRNGTPVRIRAIRPDDAGKVRDAFHKLDPQSVYTRFFSFKKELSAEELDHLVQTDFQHSVALAAALGSGDDEILIGGASYHTARADDGTRVAEVAFTIEEDFQGQGLASLLLTALATIAREQGIARFEAEVLPINAAMLSVFEHCGLPTTIAREDGVVRVKIDLGKTSPAT